MLICKRKITRGQSWIKEKRGRPEGCSSARVPLAEGLLGSAVSQEGLNAQWETKPCLLWVYSQDKALSGCADIVSTVRGKKDPQSEGGEKKEPPKTTRDRIKKRAGDGEKRFSPQLQRTL